jgi:hypothetical protein
MVLAVPMRHPRKLGGDSLNERLLLVRHPQHHRLTQLCGPLLGLADETLDLVGGAGHQRLGEPDPLGVEFADHVERFVSLFGLESVNAQDQGVAVAIHVGQDGRILLSGRDHDPITPQSAGNGVLGERDVVRVGQFGTQLGYGPVPCKTPVPDPTEHAPADDPPGQGDLSFGQGAECACVRRAGVVGAVDQFAHQFHRPVEREEPVEPMIANRQRATTHRAVTLLDSQNLLGKHRVGWPTHRSSPPKNQDKRYSIPTAQTLVSFRTGR